jgi:hypothetical protein
MEQIQIKKRFINVTTPNDATGDIGNSLGQMCISFNEPVLIVGFQGYDIEEYSTRFPSVGTEGLPFITIPSLESTNSPLVQQNRDQRTQLTNEPKLLQTQWFLDGTLIPYLMNDQHYQRYFSTYYSGWVFYVSKP